MDAFAEADVVVCLTNYVRKQLSEKWGRKVRARLVVIPPVIATPRPVNLRKPPVNKPFILFLGNKNSPMDLAMLLVAYRGLEHLAKLVIAGAGTPVQARSSDVLDIGECDEKTKRWLLCNCELLCAPSSEEAFGMIYAEAMSYGKPVIALRVPSLIEIITDEATGILVKPEDTDGLRMSLARLLLDKELRRRMGEAAYKQYLEKFSSERVIGSILQLYKEVIGGKGQEPEVKTKTRRKPRIFSE